MNIFAGSDNTSEDGSDRERIVMSERLLVIVHYDDQLTRAQVER